MQGQLHANLQFRHREKAGSRRAIVLQLAAFVNTCLARGPAVFHSPIHRRPCVHSLFIDGSHGLPHLRVSLSRPAVRKRGVLRQLPSSEGSLTIPQSDVHRPFRLLNHSTKWFTTGPLDGTSSEFSLPRDGRWKMFLTRTQIQSYD